MTLKEYVWYHDAHLLSAWDHTAQLTAMIHNLISVVGNALSGKTKIKPHTSEYFHPYRQVEVPRTHRVTADTIHVLRHIGNNMVRSR